MIYVASPYTHPNTLVMANRYVFVRSYIAKCFKEGVVAFSPIVYSHEMALAHDLPMDAAPWWNFNRCFLRKADEVHLLKMNGWAASKGVEVETRMARALGLPVKEVEWPV